MQWEMRVLHARINDWFNPEKARHRKLVHRCGSLEFVLDSFTEWARRPQPLIVHPDIVAAVREVMLCPCLISEHYDEGCDPEYNPDEESDGVQSHQESSAGEYDDSLASGDEDVIQLDGSRSAEADDAESEDCA